MVPQLYYDILTQDNVRCKKVMIENIPIVMIYTKHRTMHTRIHNYVHDYDDTEY